MRADLRKSCAASSSTDRDAISQPHRRRGELSLPPCGHHAAALVRHCPAFSPCRWARTAQGRDEQPSSCPRRSTSSGRVCNGVTRSISALPWHGSRTSSHRHLRMGWLWGSGPRAGAARTTFCALDRIGGSWRWFPPTPMSKDHRHLQHVPPITCGSWILSDDLTLAVVGAIGDLDTISCPTHGSHRCPATGRPTSAPADAREYSARPAATSRIRRRHG